jgi:hypothetical protein
MSVSRQISGSRSHQRIDEAEAVSRDSFSNLSELAFASQSWRALLPV